MLKAGKIYNNHNNAVKGILSDIINFGEVISPRGLKTKEILNYGFSIENTKKILSLTNRKLNYAFSIIEKMSFVSGNENPLLLMIYNKQLSNFFNFNKHEFDGDYTPRINNQICGVIEELNENPDSRRAVITIRNSSDTYVTKDHPCTLSLQFIIRNNTLHLITTMRSNDAYLSTSGYDIINFTFIQNYVAFMLGIEKTMYHHNVGSLHIYDIHLDKSKKLIKNINKKNNINNEIPHDFTENIDFTDFWINEHNIRHIGKYNPTGYDLIDSQLEYIKNWWDKKSKPNKNRFNTMKQHIMLFQNKPIPTTYNDDNYATILFKYKTLV